jgi:hypothetical protein
MTLHVCRYASIWGPRGSNPSSAEVVFSSSDLKCAGYSITKRNHIVYVLIHDVSFITLSF